MYLVLPGEKYKFQISQKLYKSTTDEANTNFRAMGKRMLLRKRIQFVFELLTLNCGFNVDKY